MGRDLLGESTLDDMRDIRGIYRRIDIILFIINVYSLLVEEVGNIGTVPVNYQDWDIKAERNPIIPLKRNDNKRK